VNETSPDRAHRCFTAKTAKGAKTIAKDIAFFTHRTIATPHRGLVAEDW
jgi:hypothetical protein